MIEIVEAGVFATVQDLGRFGYAHLGVPRSGAADTTSHLLANRLVGNRRCEATIEFTLGGAVRVVDGPLSVSVTGAPTGVLVNGRHVAQNQALRLEQGDQLSIRPPRHGLRNYLAVTGGVLARQVLSSRSTDTLSGLGPEPLSPGDRFSVGEPSGAITGSIDTNLVVGRHVYASEIALTYVPFLQDEFFTPASLRAFRTEAWVVQPESNRVGVRLTGTPLRYRRESSIASAGIPLGAIEIPPSGMPIVMMADHPTVGGYPLIGVLGRRDVDLLAQARPGVRVRFSRDARPLARMGTHNTNGVDGR